MKWIDPKKDTPKNKELVFLCFKHKRYPKKFVTTGVRDFDEWKFSNYKTTPTNKTLYSELFTVNNQITIKFWAKIEFPTTTPTKKEGINNRFELLDL